MRFRSRSALHVNYNKRNRFYFFLLSATHEFDCWRAVVRSGRNACARNDRDHDQFGRNFADLRWLACNSRGVRELCTVENNPKYSRSETETEKNDLMVFFLGERMMGAVVRWTFIFNGYVGTSYYHSNDKMFKFLFFFLKSIILGIITKR